MNTARFNVTRQAAFCDDSDTLIDTVASSHSASSAVAYLDRIPRTPARPGHSLHGHSRFWDTVTRLYTDGYETFEIVPQTATAEARDELMSAALGQRWPETRWQVTTLARRTHLHWFGGPTLIEVAEYLGAVDSLDVVMHRSQPTVPSPDELVAALAAKHCEIDDLDIEYRSEEGAVLDAGRTADYVDHRAVLVEEALELAEQIIGQAELGHTPTSWRRVHLT